MEIEITDKLTVDESLRDGEICINVMPTYGEEVYVYLTKEHVEKLLSMFDK